MCGRFSLAEDHDFLAARLGISAMALADYRPRYNIAPQQENFYRHDRIRESQAGARQMGLVPNPGEHGGAKPLSHNAIVGFVTETS